jgi:hypothetical protein
MFSLTYTLSGLDLIMEKLDQKTTLNEQLSYIYITLRETLNILGTHLKNATILHFRRTFIQP